jgi:hypothetical protein
MQTLQDSGFDNGQNELAIAANARELQKLQNAADSRNVNADDAAHLFYADPAWRARFEARCENEREAARAEAEEALRDAQAKLAALGIETNERGYFTKITPSPAVKKSVGRPKKIAAPAPKPAKAKAGSKLEGDLESARAFQFIKDAGKEGIGTIQLAKLINARPGPIVASLIESGKVRTEGVKRGTKYFVA